MAWLSADVDIPSSTAARLKTTALGDLLEGSKFAEHGPDRCMIFMIALHGSLPMQHPSTD